MAWMLIFWLYNGAGTIVSVDTLHGFAHRGDCVVFAKAIPPMNGRVEWKCVRDPSAAQEDLHHESKGAKVSRL